MLHMLHNTRSVAVVADEPLTIMMVPRVSAGSNPAGGTI
jgi:hypothetical protein